MFFNGQWFLTLINFYFKICFKINLRNMKIRKTTRARAANAFVFKLVFHHADWLVFLVDKVDKRNIQCMTKWCDDELRGYHQRRSLIGWFAGTSWKLHVEIIICLFSFFCPHFYEYIAFRLCYLCFLDFVEKIRFFLLCVVFISSFI